MEHRGVDSRTHDGRVSGPLTSSLAPLVLEQSRNFALRHARLDGANGGKLGCDGGIRGLADQCQLTGIFEGAQRLQQRTNIAKRRAHGESISVFEPAEWLGRI